MTKGENGDLGWARLGRQGRARRARRARMVGMYENLGGGGSAHEKRNVCIHREFEFNDFFTGLYTNVQK